MWVAGWQRTIGHSSNRGCEWEGVGVVYPGQSDRQTYSERSSLWQPMRAGETAGDSERGLGERGSSLKEWPVGVAALFGCGLSMDRAGMREPSWWQPIERRLRAAR
jgi:hypothetical protein